MYPAKSSATRLAITTGLASLLVGALMTGCSSSDSGGDGNPNGGLTGSPVRVMTISAVETGGVAYPSILEVAKMYARNLNARGGIKGHPLVVETCDQKVDPNAALACARKAVTDKVVAVVGAYTTYAPQVLPLLKQNGIAYFGPAASPGGLEQTSSNSFVLAPQAVTLSAPAYAAYKDGCQKAAFFVSSAAVAPFLIQLAETGLKAAGGSSFKTIVKAPLTTGDLSPQAAQLTSGTDCIVGTVGAQTWAALVPAIAQTGKTPRLYLQAGQIPDKLAAQYPKVLEKAQQAATTVSLSSPAFKDLRDSIQKYSPPADNYNNIDLATWASYHAFEQIAENISSTINAKSFLTQAAKTRVKMNGMMPDVDLRTPWTAKNFPRLFNRKITFTTFKDGKQDTGNGKFVDLGTLLTGS